MVLRCVVVDDNHDFLRAAGELLDRDGVSVVGFASTGAEACRACEEFEPDVVLIDIDLGEETGMEVARLLDARHQGAGQPRMILVSAYSEDDVADVIAGSPAVSFLPKADLSGAAVRRILNGAVGSGVLARQRDSR